MVQLRQQDRTASLGQKQKREAGGYQRVVLESPHADPVVRGIAALDLHQVVGSLPIPVVLSDESLRGEPSHALQGIEVIEHPGFRPAGVMSHGEHAVASQPTETRPDLIFLRLPLLTAADSVALGLCVAWADLVGGDHQGSDAGGGHAAGARCPRGVAPGAVVVLGRLPMGLGSPPGLTAHLHAHPLRLVKGQHRELRVGIVTVAAQARIRPGPRGRPIDELRLLQPPHVAVDQPAVLVGTGRREGHGLQGDDVGLLGLELLQVLQRPADAIVLGILSRVQ